MMFHNDKWKLKAGIAGTFLFLSILMYLSPLSSDDYRLLAYDFSGVKEAFIFNLEYANGRILGNYLGWFAFSSQCL